jgi:hypothetical protein
MGIKMALKFHVHIERNSTQRTNKCNSGLLIGFQFFTTITLARCTMATCLVLFQSFKTVGELFIAFITLLLVTSDFTADGCCMLFDSKISLPQVLHNASDIW